MRLGIWWIWFWSQRGTPKEDTSSCWARASFERWSCFSGVLYFVTSLMQHKDRKTYQIRLLWGKNDLWLVVIGNFRSQSLPLGFLQDLHINIINISIWQCQTFVTITITQINHCQQAEIDSKLQETWPTQRHTNDATKCLCPQARGKKPRPSEKLAHMQTSLHLGNDEFGERSPLVCGGTLVSQLDWLWQGWISTLETMESFLRRRLFQWIMRIHLSS